MHHRHRWRNRILPLTIQIHDLSCYCTLLLLRSQTDYQDLGVSAWSGLNCAPNPVFIPREFEVPPSLIDSFGKLFPIPNSVTVAPIQFHILVLATFASLIAPFGGFFASGLKRAFQIKDFGDSIPGHGGMTDRMDCQFIMVITPPSCSNIAYDRDSSVTCTIRVLLLFDMSLWAHFYKLRSSLYHQRNNLNWSKDCIGI
jgi:Cytidylyltransferase family